LNRKEVDLKYKAKFHKKNGNAKCNSWSNLSRYFGLLRNFGEVFQSPVHKIIQTMKEFFKFMFASMLGFFLVSVIFFFILFGMIASLAAFSKRNTVDVKPNSVLHITLSSPIVDRGGGSPFDSFDPFSMWPGASMGLNDIVANLEKAKKDDNIKGILLDLTSTQAGMATLGEIRQAIEEFKESGKFVISYGEMYSQGAYYLASVSDRVYLHPEGMIDFRGLNAEVVFLSNMLKKIGVEAQIIRHGEFKSAAEPLMLERMSPENREQILSYTSSIWNHLLDEISRSRGLTINHLNEVANQFQTRNATLALETQMIDGVKFRDELLEELRTRLDIESGKEISKVSLARYTRAPQPEGARRPVSRDKIAVVYGSGMILPGSGSEQTMGSDRIAAAIREARLDDSVKAIVFRINSPGGSALASDVILREVKLASEVKPVIASMGDLAASGGYYVACAADLIVASPKTITGSIGVFGVIPNMQELFNEKLGITFDNVKTNQFADLASVNRPLTRAERALIQESIEQVYDTFINHVAEGRNIPTSMVDSLGQGRVWSGVEALQNGLVDEYGGLAHAIAKAAEMAEIDAYRLVEFPKRKDFFTRLMEDFGGVQDVMVKRKLGDTWIYYQQIQELKDIRGIQARLPYNIIIE
jgi:protease IV